MLGDRIPTYEDMRKLEQCRLVVTETLRLFPEPPLLIRRALEVLNLKPETLKVHIAIVVSIKPVGFVMRIALKLPLGFETGGYTPARARRERGDPGQQGQDHQGFRLLPVYMESAPLPAPLGEPGRVRPRPMAAPHAPGVGEGL